MEKTPKEKDPECDWGDPYTMALRKGGKRAFHAALVVVAKEMGIK